MMRRLPSATLVVFLLVGMPLAPRAQTPAPPAAMDEYLTHVVNLSRRELADVHGGRAVSKLLPTANTRDVAVFGIIALHMTREAYVARLANLPAIAARGSTTVDAFGTIGDPPSAADFAGVSVNESEYRSYRDCEVDDCKFKLPQAAMREFAANVEWKTPNARGELDSLVRGFLLRLALGYRTLGDRAMPHYDDTHGTWGRDAFDSLAAQPSPFWDRAPELRDYLLAYPDKRPPNTRDLMYWSEQRMPRLRPTFALAHLVLYTPPSGAPIVARKLIYANHYFEAALELLTIADGPFGGDAPGIYVITERRYRFDNLPRGIFNIRGRVRDKMVTLVREDLERER